MHLKKYRSPPPIIDRAETTRATPIAPEGGLCVSPGREPWVKETAHIVSPVRAIQRSSSEKVLLIKTKVSPLQGLIRGDNSYSQGSRPGLTHAAPSELSSEQEPFWATDPKPQASRACCPKERPACPDPERARLRMKMMVFFNESRKNTTFSRYGAPGFQTGGLILRSISFGQQTLKTQAPIY